MIYWCIFGVTNDLSTDIKRKKPTQNSLESANLQEHYTIILKVRDIVCVTVIAVYCILFMTVNSRPTKYATWHFSLLI